MMNILALPLVIFKLTKLEQIKLHNLGKFHYNTTFAVGFHEHTILALLALLPTLYSHIYLLITSLCESYDVNKYIRK